MELQKQNENDVRGKNLDRLLDWRRGGGGGGQVFVSDLAERGGAKGSVVGRVNMDG